MAISIQPLASFVALSLLIAMIVIVRTLSVAIVSHFGVSGGLVALALLFGAAYLFGD